MPITDEMRQRARINRLFKEARTKLQGGMAYTIDQLLEVDGLTDAEVLAVMDRLDNHPLINRDSDFPRRWTLR